MDNREEMSSWTLVRRYAVPRWMIEQATERRLAGDWAGACAAAHVDVGFDLAEVAGGYGARAAADLEADLRHLAPDLLRWHLPRVLNGRTSVGTLRALVLGRYGDGVLHVVTPPMVDGPQRLRLLFRRKPLRRVPRGHTSIVAEDWSGVRHLWDARSSAGLRPTTAEPAGRRSSTPTARRSPRTSFPAPRRTPPTPPPTTSGSRCCTSAVSWRPRSRPPGPSRTSATRACRAGPGPIRAA
ncbi:hypothetical protein ACFQU9_09575 [Actinomadura namibiensis]|uniref:hypothetical protein n=1 Tax=Actinomadura kijaniata TaxID=46161 RepID=UPI0036104EA3